ncbi:hypothetical protein PR048_027975 [Dryococelus australis]|uniref:Uncharacterized protein n=1 Tax=Dryococelus australis TaxID=614101 RepID=A0ABQ9GHY5_9NEOP|nr:hypothetical protein PR048_027975 [Dryococelus australis]
MGNGCSPGWLFAVDGLAAILVDVTPKPPVLLFLANGDHIDFPCTGHTSVSMPVKVYVCRCMFQSSDLRDGQCVREIVFITSPSRKSNCVHSLRHDFGFIVEPKRMSSGSGVAARALSSRLGVTGSITSDVILRIVHVGFVPYVGGFSRRSPVSLCLAFWSSSSQSYKRHILLAMPWSTLRQCSKDMPALLEEHGIPIKWKTQLNVCKPTGTSYAGVTSFTQESVSKFHDNYAEELEKKTYTPDRIWNVDESELSIVLSKIPEVIGLAEHEDGTVEISASVLVAPQHEEPRVVPSTPASSQMLEQPETLDKRSESYTTCCCGNIFALQTNVSSVIREVKEKKSQSDKVRGNFKRGGAASAGTGRTWETKDPKLETLIWTSAFLKVDLQLRIMQTACFVVKVFNGLQSRDVNSVCTVQLVGTLKTRISFPDNAVHLSISSFGNNDGPGLDLMGFPIGWTAAPAGKLSYQDLIGGRHFDLSLHNDAILLACAGRVFGNL